MSVLNVDFKVKQSPVGGTKVADTSFPAFRITCQSRALQLAQAFNNPSSFGHTSRERMCWMTVSTRPYRALITC